MAERLVYPLYYAAKAGQKEAGQWLRYDSPTALCFLDGGGTLSLQQRADAPAPESFYPGAVSVSEAEFQTAYKRVLAQLNLLAVADAGPATSLLRRGTEDRWFYRQDGPQAQLRFNLWPRRDGRPGVLVICENFALHPQLRNLEHQPDPRRQPCTEAEFRAAWGEVHRALLHQKGESAG